MSEISRRGFFRQFTENLADQINLDSAKSAVSTLFNSENKNADWIEVGKLADFKPGVVQFLTIDSSLIKIVSSFEGVWAEREDGRCMKLRLDSLGILSINTFVFLEKGKMLSHLTGEII